MIWGAIPSLTSTLCRTNRQILLVPLLCLSLAITLWHTLAFPSANCRILLHGFLPLPNSLRFNLYSFENWTESAGCNFKEYLWLKAAAKNDQYKAGSKLTRVLIQLWFALQKYSRRVFCLRTCIPACLQAPLHQLFNAVSYPFQARKKACSIVQMVYLQSEPSWGCTRRGSWPLQVEGKGQKVWLGSHCRLRILPQIGFNGAYNVKVGGESLKFRCRARGEMRKVLKCVDFWGLVQSWLSFRSISRRKARQCSAVGTSDWQQTEQSENVDWIEQ